MTERAPQHRNVCFTVNADYPHQLRLLDMEHSSWAKVKFCVYQRECAEHEHFQGYLELDSSMTFSALHNLEGLEGAHFEKRKGSAKQASHYCVKPVPGCECNICVEELRSPTYLEGPWTIGTMSAQGQRADLMEIQKELNKGASLKRIREEFFPEWVRFRGAFTEYRRLMTEPRTWKTRVFLFIGPAGAGKSTLMKTIAKYCGTVYKAPMKKGSGQYFDGYEGEDVFIIDEFDGSRMRPEDFNQLADEHEHTLPCHGAAGYQMVSKYLFIGTNYLPGQWWKNRNAAQVKQTTRRIDVVFKVGFKDAIRWDHSGFQEFGPNINRPQVIPPKDKEELYDLEPMIWE